MTFATGTILTCTNADCSCRLEVQEPCPHGDDFTCACGHAFTTVPPDVPDAPVVTPGA